MNNNIEEPGNLSAPNKPKKGFWTAFPAVINGEFTNTWEMAPPSDQYEYNYEYYLEVEGSPKVLRITGNDDYELQDFLERNNWEVDGEHYDSVYNLSWKQSLKYVNQLAYYDTIPIDAIEVISSKFL